MQCGFLFVGEDEGGSAVVWLQAVLEKSIKAFQFFTYLSFLIQI